MDKKLLDIIACPACKGPLKLAAARDRLVCRAERLSFPIREGIPVLLEEEAATLSTDELDAALKNAP